MFNTYRLMLKFLLTKCLKMKQNALKRKVKKFIKPVLTESRS